MKIHFRCMTIFGVGLIGGSLARICKKERIVDKIVGVGRTEGNLKRAKELGVIDEYYFDGKRAVRDADIVVLATPVSSFVKLVKEIVPHLNKGTIIIDVGSVKLGFLMEVENLMPEGVHFIGTHPIAGTEKSGVEASFLELFEGSKCIITPTPKTNQGALEAVKELWRLTGSHIILMDPARHDRILAAVSHLPHLIAYALVNTIEDIDNIEHDVVTYTAGGFKDFTRIASSSPEMWRDICLLNKASIIESVNRFKYNLELLKNFIESDDGKGLEESFKRAKYLRDNMNK